MKSLPQAVPAGRYLALFCLIIFNVSQPLLAQDERDTVRYVDKSMPSTISKDLDSNPLEFSDVPQSSDAFHPELSNEINKKGQIVSLQRPAGPQQKVVFDYQTNGKYAAVYTCQLIIDSTFQTKFMSCCDVVLPTSILAPHVAIRKAGSSLSVATYPLSSYYPIVAYGDGTLMASGSPGFFFLPPNLYPGSQPLPLKGPGPHKVYWLGEDHPDSDSAELIKVEDSMLVDPSVRFIRGKWQRRIRLK